MTPESTQTMSQCCHNAATAALLLVREVRARAGGGSRVGRIGPVRAGSAPPGATVRCRACLRSLGLRHAHCGERPMTTRRSTFVTGAAMLGASALLLAACSPGSSDDDSGDGDSGATTVTFRLWDESAAAAYEETFAAFSDQHPDIDVEVETVPWANYCARLPQDIGSGTMADIFWTNTSNFGLYVD